MAALISSLPLSSWRLELVSSHKLKKRIIALTENTALVVGRNNEQADIVIPHDKVSRKHAELLLLNGKLRVRDLNSINGTFVNGKAIKETIICRGDTLAFETIAFRLCCEQEAASDATKVSTAVSPHHKLNTSPAKKKSTRHTPIEATQQVRVDLGFLIGKCPKFNQQSFPLPKTKLSIGRDVNNDLRLKESSVSAMHAELNYENGQWLLRDTGSANGTYVNGKRINVPTPIKSDYEIRIANVCLVYQLSYLQNKYGKKATKNTSQSKARHLFERLGKKKIALLGIFLLSITVLGINPPKWLSANTQYLQLAQQIKSIFHRHTNNDAAVLSLKLTWPTQHLPANRLATSPALNTIPGKPGLAIIIADDAGQVRALNGIDGNEIFKINLKYKILSPINTQKQTLNQVRNIIIAHYHGQVTLLDSDGQTLWQSAENHNLGHFIHRPISIDSNKDGVNDIVLASSKQGLVALDGNRSGWLLWQSKDLVLGELSATPISVDLNQDGDREFVTVSDSGQVLALALTNGMLKTLWQQQLNPIRFTSPSLIPGQPSRISVITEDNELIALNAFDGSVAWQADLGGLHLTSPISGRINGDQNHDVFTISSDGLVQSFDGLNGKIIWRQQLSHHVLANAVVFDLDNDTHDDIIIADSSGSLHILSGKTGTYLLQDFIIKGADGFSASPLLGDVNGNGLLDLITVSRNGLINSFELNRSSPIGDQAPWPVFLGNEQHASP